MSKLIQQLQILTAAAKPANVDELFIDITAFCNAIISALDGDLTYPENAVQSAKAIKNAIKQWQHKSAAPVTASRANGTYPVKFAVELTKWEDLAGLIEFWRYIRNSANGGHSFNIEADREGNQPAKAKVSIDGDGNDKVGRIFINDRVIPEKGDVTKRLRALTASKIDLSKLSNDEIAARVQNEKLAQPERQIAYDEFKRRGLLRPKRKPKQRAWNRASSVASDNPHSAVIESLMHTGYRYRGKKIGDKLTHHTMRYESKATLEHNARIKHTLTQHGFTHSKTPKGHDYRRPDAHIRIESVPGGTRLQYIHRNLPKASTAAANKPAEKNKPVEKSLVKPIVQVLKKHGFTGKATANRGTKFPYKGNKGILTQPLVDNLFRDMVKLGLTPFGTRSEPTWYDRDQNILVQLGGKTGEHYYAQIVHMDR